MDHTEIELPLLLQPTQFTCVILLKLELFLLLNWTQTLLLPKKKGTLNTYRQYVHL